MNKILYIVLFLSCLGLVTLAQQIPDIEINLKPGKYTVDQVLDILNQYEGINLVYNASPDEFESFVVLNRQSYKLKDILDIICEELVYDYTIKQDYIILKKRKLEDSYRLKGVIRDNETGSGLMAANVYVLNSGIGIVANDSGYFELELKPGKYTLISSYVGYEPEITTINLYGNDIVNFHLKPGENQIEEVLVFGHKNTLQDIETGRTIETIERRDIEQVKLNNAADVLQGRLKGVWVTKTSGAPGDQQKIRIRGINSIFSSVEPLFIVDGVPVPIVNQHSMGIAHVNVNDIDRISILKDASSSAMYGYLGGNGVIVINTKTGNKSDGINFYTMHGLQQFNKRYDLLNSEQYLNNYQLSDSLFKTTYFYNLEEPFARYPVYNDSILTTEWQDQLFNLGTVNEYQLSGGGTTSLFNYYLSGNYYSHDGVIGNSEYTKYSMAANLSRSFLDRIYIHLNYKGSKQENKNNTNEYLGNSLIYKGISLEPNLKFTQDSFLMKEYRNLLLFPDISSEFVTPNGLEDYINNRSLTNTSSYHSLHSSLNAYLFDNLTFTANFSYSTQIKNFSSVRWQQDFNSIRSEYYLKSRDNYRILNQAYNLKWNKRFNSHSLSTRLTYRIYRDNIFWQLTDNMGIDINDVQDASQFHQKGSLLLYGNKGAVLRRINSFIPNINYNYKEKYFISVLSNFDHLQEGKYVDQKAVFPSVAINWDISKEPGLNRIRHLDFANLYVNWGVTGNYPLNSTSNELYQNIKPVNNNEGRDGYYVTSLANHYLKHEEIKETNFGTELSFFKERVILATDYYRKEHDNLLLSRKIPLYYGGGLMFINTGKMSSSGVEASLEVELVRNSQFNLNSKISFSKNEQKVISLFERDTLFFDHSDLMMPDFIVAENMELGNLYTYKYLGPWSAGNDTLTGLARKYTGKYFNSDTIGTILDMSDRVVTGNSIPDYTFNFQINASYRNFEMNMLWYGVIGVDKYNATKAFTYATGVNSETTSILQDSLKLLMDETYYHSSAFIEDASFVRMKNLSLTYHFGNLFSKQIAASITLTLENLITFTRYSGYDPEASIYTTNNFSDNAIDRGAYPNPKGYYLSINLRF